jgi:hypothetical protein
MDDFVGAPSGVGYIYPSVWPADKLVEFGGLTDIYLKKTSAASDTTVSTINVIGDPCIGGTFAVPATPSICMSLSLPLPLPLPLSLPLSLL